MWKSLPYLPLLILLISGYQQPVNLNAISWLAGEWKQTNVKPGRSGIEKWKKVSDSEYRGESVSLMEVDTVSYEKMHIMIERDTIFFVAEVAGNTKPVYFRITKIDKSGFRCENPLHDFPKALEYTINGDHLSATISGNGKRIVYNFKRKKI